MWTLHTDSGNNVYGGQTAKNIYLGDTRIVTKLNSGDEPTYNEEYYKQYYYHSDHLGSASLITDYKGEEYQRIEYTPYGETWVEKTGNTGLEYLPYKFTGKEIDEETGLYYYGARYLDPRYSRWISTDPALGEYIPQAPINDEAKKSNQNLPGMGGVFNHINGNLYAYAGNKPVKYTDPDGRVVDTIWDIGFTLYDIGSAIYKSSKGDNSGWIDVGLDAAAILVPGIPAGLSKIDDAVKLARKADKIGDAVRTADKVGDTAKVLKSSRPNQVHHFATNKNSRYTKQMSDIADKYGLKLDGDWNKELLPHQGRHPNDYHDFVLDGMNRASNEAGSDTSKFLELFDKYVKEPVRNNSDLLRKTGWE